MRSLLFGSLLLSMACSSGSAFADQVAIPQPPGPRTALAIAPAKVRAPYDVQIVRENGETLPTFAFKDRFYVQGNVGERYIIRVTNPTPNRVEAVVSVDGLDVIDGETGDTHKRGYIVPPYGDVRVEGFRTSLDDVATFRFSGVDGSYAGMKGKPRNVGVIAVAIFEEQAPPPEQQIVGPTTPDPVPAPGRPYRYTDDLDARAVPRPSPTPTGGGRAAPAKDAAKAERPAAGTASASAPSRRGNYKYDDDEGEALGGTETLPAPQTHRPGLGTQYGEQRYSSASYTRFVRAAGRPVAIAELRYNDTAGLVALGIQVQPLPDPGEIMTRETADPFPGDHFATPPR